VVDPFGGAGSRDANPDRGEGPAGSGCGPGDDFPGYENIHVGVQRRRRPDQLLELQPGDAPSARWTLDSTVARSPASTDVTGPHIQGRPGERFIYLSWGTVDDAGNFTMFRRAKLMLNDIDPKVLSRAERTGQLVARLRLTDRNGRPLCARVRPPAVEWSAD
jgi:hypothetical protein